MYHFENGFRSREKKKKMPSSLFLMSSRQRGRNYGELSAGHDFLSARGSGDGGGGVVGGVHY